MTRNQQMEFELYVMDLAVEGKCKTAKDFENFSENLHVLVENAIQDLCMDYDIEDYSPNY